jgi:hypothetical protein
MTVYCFYKYMIRCCIRRYSYVLIPKGIERDLDICPVYQKWLEKMSSFQKVAVFSMQSVGSSSRASS